MDNTEAAALKLGAICPENGDMLKQDLSKFQAVCRKFANLWWITECAQSRINPDKAQCEPRTFLMETTLKDIIRKELVTLSEECETKAQRLREAKSQKSQDQAAALLEQAKTYRKKSENKCCERNYIYEVIEPGWMSWVAEAIASTTNGAVLKKWRAKDPNYGTARRNFLAVNGQREGVACHKVSLKIKNDVWKFININGRIGVSFRTRRDIPAYEVFFLGRKQKNGKRRLEPQQIFVLKQLGAIGDKGERWKRGDLLVTTDHKNQLRVVITYKRPQSTKSDLDPNRILEVSFQEDPEEFMVMSLISGKKGIVDDKRNWSESANAAVKDMKRREKHKNRLGAELRATTTNQTARKDVRDKQAKHTQRRTKTQERWNGTWTSRIIHRALAWRAAEIQVKPTPHDKEQGSHLFGLPWGWYRFGEMLRYKCSKRGITLHIGDNKDAG